MWGNIVAKESCPFLGDMHYDCGHRALELGFAYWAVEIPLIANFFCYKIYHRRIGPQKQEGGVEFISRVQN